MIDSAGNILRTLRSVSIFSETPDDVLAELVPRLDEVSLEPGDVLFEQGEEGDGMYIVVEGLVRIYQGKRTISNRGELEVFGEMALLSTMPRMGSVSALRKTRLLHLKRQTFSALLEKRPDILQGVTGVLINRLHEQAEDLSRLRTRMEQVILPLGIALSTEHDTDRLLERILREAQDICNADAGIVYLRDAETLRYSLMNIQSRHLSLGGKQGRSMPFAPLSLFDGRGKPRYQDVAVCVALKNQSINIPHIDKAHDFDFSTLRSVDKRNRYRSVSCLTTPLRGHEQQVIGVFQLFNAQDRVSQEVIPFDPYQQLMVEALASQAAVVFNTHRLIEAHKTLTRVEKELQIGRQIQIDFLPSPSALPRPNGWEIAARFEPAREVAGDFYDAFPLPDGRIAVVIADVVDKGVGAAIFMALCRSLIRAFAQQPVINPTAPSMADGRNPAFPSEPLPDRAETFRGGAEHAFSAVKFTNDYIATNHGDMCMFTTLFFGAIDTETGVMSYINGGHDAPFFVSATGRVKRRLAPTGPSVGMSPGIKFQIARIQFEPGDLLMTFSDGVPDALNSEGVRFTHDRLSTLLEESSPILSAAALLEDIQEDLSTYIGSAEQFDDITMLAVWRKPMKKGDLATIGEAKEPIGGERRLARIRDAANGRQPLRPRLIAPSR